MNQGLQYLCERQAACFPGTDGLFAFRRYALFDFPPGNQRTRQETASGIPRCNETIFLAYVRDGEPPC